MSWDLTQWTCFSLVDVCISEYVFVIQVDGKFPVDPAFSLLPPGLPGETNLGYKVLH